VVVSLGIRPLVCFGQILKSSDEIPSGNGVLAFGTKEFRNLVLLYSEVEVGGPVASTWCGGNISLGCGIAGAVVVSIEIDIAIVVVIMVVFRGLVDIITSSSGHFCRAKDLNSLIKTPVFFRSLLWSVKLCERRYLRHFSAGRSGKRLFDVVSACRFFCFWKRHSFLECHPFCVLVLGSLPWTVSCERCSFSDVVASACRLESVVLFFSVVHF
jgi:hypothetical protein